MFVRAAHVLGTNFRRDDSQATQRSHTASLDCIAKTVSKNLDSNLLFKHSVNQMQNNVDILLPFRFRLC